MEEIMKVIIQLLVLATFPLWFIPYGFWYTIGKYLWKDVGDCVEKWQKKRKKHINDTPGPHCDCESCKECKAKGY